MSADTGAPSRRDKGGALSALPFLRIGRTFARLAAATLIVGPLAILGSATPAAAVAPSVTVSVTGGGNVIAGDDATYSISAHNSGGTDGFNLALTLDVPDGVAFVSSSLGTPVIYSNADYPSTIAAGTFRWVWEDVSDLPSGGTFGGSVVVHPTQPAIDNTGTAETPLTTVFPVGSTYSVIGHAYLGGTASLLPVFDGSTGVGGEPATSETGIAAASSAATNMIALTLAKAEPSPEAELPRGAHDHTTVYTLTVTETTQGDTDDAILVDFIPAGLEFLGCGGVDNSTIDWATGDPTVNEYPGAPDLTGTPVIPLAQCPTPASVNTVVASPTDATTYGVTAGLVYTRVEWNLGTLALGSVTTVQYRAAVPLYENTVTWAPAATPAATTVLPNGSQGQAANLDNNNGPSTRQGDLTLTGPPTDGHTWTNVVNVVGDYQGVVRTAAPRATTARAQETIYAMDLAVQKSITAGGTFVTGGQTTFQLNLEASEYMDSSAIVLTDVMGNGLCPLVPTGTPLINPSGLVVTDCTGIDGVVTGATVESVTAHADGSWDMILHPTVATIAANGTHTITYKALNRAEYELAPTEYGPTTSGDGFGNTVSFTAVTDAIAVLEPSFSETWNVWDDSGSSMPTDYTTINKRVLSRDDVTQGLAPGVDPCTSGTGTWNEDLATGYRFGDTACFELTVNFPTTVDVRNPVVTDFLPAGLTYDGYAIVTGPTGSATPTTLDAAGGRLEWTLGDIAVVGLPDRYVPRSSTFVAHVWATVDGPSTGNGMAPLDKPQNLMKYRQQNVDGVLYFLREEAAVEIDPEMQLVKGVESVTPNGSAVPDYTRAATSQDNADGSVFGSNRDGITVREGEKVTYRVDLSTMPYGATDATVWDALPPGILAADVSGISDLGYAADPGDADYPGGASYPGVTMDPTLIGPFPPGDLRSVVVWTGIDVPYDSGTHQAHKTLNYTVTIPIGTSVATTHDNEASIIRYSADINTDPPGTSAQDYYPTDSFDVSHGGATPAIPWNTPGDGTRDDSSVHLPLATLTKSATSPTDTNNSPAQVVKGEIGGFTYVVTIPAYTSVENGLLSDAFLLDPSHFWSIETGLTTIEYPGVSATPPPGTPGSPGYDGAFTVGTTPGFDIDATTGTLDFPALYTNDTGSDQTFTVHLFAHVKGASTWAHGTFHGDEASFASDTQDTITADSGLTVITPNPTIIKTANGVQRETVTVTGQTVTYGFRPQHHRQSADTAFDTVVTDCVPVGLTVTTPLGAPTQGTASIVADPTCPVTNTSIVWEVGSLLSGAANYETLTYTATVSPDAAGLATYTNSARITGYSLDDESADRAKYSPTQVNRTITVLGAELTKLVNGVATDTASIGEEATYTLTATIPASVNFWDAAVIDDVPSELAIPADTDFTDVSLTCTYADLTPCIAADVPPGWGTQLPTSGTTHGWWLGDITSAGQARILTITYPGTVRNVDPPNTAGHGIVNTAKLKWDTANNATDPPSNAVYPDVKSVSPRTATLTVVEPAPTIDKTVAPTTVTAGQVVTYTLTAANAAGLPPSYDTQVIDCVPVALQSVTVTSYDGSEPVVTIGGGGCSGTQIVWDAGTINGGTSKTATYTATVSPASAGEDSYTNTANLTGYSADDLAADRRSYTDSDDATVTVLGAALDKGVDVPTATIGEQRDYTISMDIPALVNFYDAAIVDDVPAELAIPADTDFANVTLTCTYADLTPCVAADLPPGWGTQLPTSGTTHGWWLGDIASRPQDRILTLAYTGTVLNDTTNVAGHNIVNTAVLRWNTESRMDDPPATADHVFDEASGTDTATVTVVEPHVTIVKKVDGEDAITAGATQSFTYDVAIANTGGSTAYDITVTDVIPQYVIVDPLSISVGGGIVGASATTGGGTITWTLSSLAVGAGATHHFSYSGVLADGGYLDGSDLTNVATVTSFASHPLATTPGFTDGVRRTYPVAPDPAPWADAVVTPVFPHPVITKTPTESIAYIGESDEFTIVVTNDGDAPATAVVLNDLLPPNWDYDAGSATVSLNGAAGVASEPTVSGQNLNWGVLPDLGVDGYVTIVYTATPNAGATWDTTNTGSGYDHTNSTLTRFQDEGSATENALNALNDPPGYVASTTADVQIHSADLAIDKAHNPALDPTAGSAFSWTLTVTNGEFSDPAEGPIVVVDTLPAAATYIGFTATAPDGRTTCPGCPAR